MKTSNPFVSSNIEFFWEFSQMGLGMAVERDPERFSEALLEMEQDMEKYKKAVHAFSRKTTWDEVARKHISVYGSLLNEKPKDCISGLKLQIK